MPIMPTFTPALEPPRRLAAGGEDGGAVAVRVGVDQAMASSTVSARTTDSTGPKISSRVDVHRGVTWSMTVGPDPEAVLVTRDR
jgi:hypothetical protein